MQTDFPRLTDSVIHRLEHDVVVCSEAHWRVLKASGDGLLDYLQGQITQDIKRLSRERAIHACLLTPQGKAVSELVIMHAAGDELILLAPAEVAVEVVARLRRFALGYTLRIGIVESFAIHTAQGRHASGALARLGLETPASDWLACTGQPDKEVIALRFGMNPDRYWIVGPGERLKDGFDAPTEDTPCEALRILHGLPRFGVDWDESLHPLNANLMEFDGVSFDKGCYVGQEVTSRMHWRGGIRKKLYRVRIPADGVDNLPANLPCSVLSSARVGELRSLVLHPDGHALGIALLPIEVAEGESKLFLENEVPLEVLEPCHA